MPPPPTTTAATTAADSAADGVASPLTSLIERALHLSPVDAPAAEPAAVGGTGSGDQRVRFVCDPGQLWKPMDGVGVFGGQIIGLALSAAARTVRDEFLVHRPDRLALDFQVT
ncbi:hypothetical protein HK405_015598 [Cladochytrium tenue]|nr:hypothetical protein HK405_015598 [Cladochytrium tenue]